MALTNEQLQNRIEVIEKWINQLQTGLNNTASKRTLSNSIALITSQISSLQDVIGTVDSTGAFYPPRLTTTERDALTVNKGATIFNLTVNKTQVYNGSTWETVTSS